MYVGCARAVSSYVAGHVELGRRHYFAIECAHGGLIKSHESGYLSARGYLSDT